MEISKRIVISKKKICFKLKLVKAKDIIREINIKCHSCLKTILCLNNMQLSSILLSLKVWPIISKLSLESLSVFRFKLHNSSFV